MDSFETVPEPKLAQLLRSKEQVCLSISEDVVGFAATLSEVDFATEKEVPPTSAIFSPEGLAEVICHTSQDQEGKYVRFVVTVYALGGKIFYRSSGNNSYVARVTWPTT